MTGIVRGFEVKKNRDSGQSILMLQVEISGPDDVQSVEYMSHAGDDHIPPIDSIVTILEAGPAWKIAIASNDTIDFDSSLTEGSRKIYSSSGGTQQAATVWNADGLISESNQVQSLKSLIDELIDGIVNIVTTGSPTTHTVNAASQAALNATKAKFAQLYKDP